MHPKVSFIVPVYNVEKYLPQCIDSILAQTLTDFELILIDDGSPDGSGALCDGYARDDDRVKVIHKENAGVSAARNSGIDYATGEWAYFVDSDDWLEKDAAQTLYDYAVAHNVDCVMSYCEKCYEDGTRRRSAPFSQAFTAQDRDSIGLIQKYVLYQPYSPYYAPETTNGYAAPWGKFTKLSIIKDEKIYFDPYLKGVFDDGLWSLELLDHVQSLAYIEKKTYNYRIVGSSLTHSFKEDAIDIQERGYERIESWLVASGKDRTYWEAYYAHVVVFFGGYLRRHFFHPRNSGNASHVKDRLKSLLRRDPFKAACRGVDMPILKPKDKYLALCERSRCVAGLRLYAFLSERLGRD